MVKEGHGRNSSQNHYPTKRLTNILPILFTSLFTLLFLSAQAGITGQNEKFNNNPFPNPKTLMKLTTVAPTAASAVVPFLSTVATAVKYTATPNEPLSERRQNVAWFAASYSDWGFKYQSGSASIENGGFDCSGFVTFVLTYFDIKTKRCAAEQYTEGKQLPVEQARPGDLVFFGGKRNVSHVAMVVTNDEKGLVVVHSTNTKGVTQENITESKYWKPKLKDMAVNIIGD